jgi:hypothetical protein
MDGSKPPSADPVGISANLFLSFCSFLALRMKMLIYPSRKREGKLILQLLQTRGSDILKAAKLDEQSLPVFLSNSRNIQQITGQGSYAATVPMEIDGNTVRLIPNRLD